VTGNLASAVFGEGDARLVYVFVNQASPLAVMNSRSRGRSCRPCTPPFEVDNEFAAAYEEGRADFLPFVPNDKASTGFLSPFTAGTINGYRVEWDAEVARKQRFSEPIPAYGRLRVRAMGRLRARQWSVWLAAGGSPAVLHRARTSDAPRQHGNHLPRQDGLRPGDARCRLARSPVALVLGRETRLQHRAPR
jgi:hypothetical protein